VLSASATLAIGIATGTRNLIVASLVTSIGAFALLTAAVLRRSQQRRG
jgi:uncharacterized membrane protein (GlpM family)